ncbi:hypothetical protein ACOMHN_053346 [Nucella lapillus]
MEEVIYDFELLDADQGKVVVVDEEEENRRCAKCQETCTSLLHTLATPVTDCRRRSHPRIVPDYSVLVLMTCVTNPVLGVIVCCLHTYAKNLSHRGETGKADAVYLAMMAMAMLAIGASLMCVSLLSIRHLVYQFNEDNIRAAKPARDCFFREEDYRVMKELNLTRNNFCRRKLSLNNTGGPWFTNATTVIDKTRTQISRP